MIFCCIVIDVFFFFNDTATTEIYTLSLHDALPICSRRRPSRRSGRRRERSGRSSRTSSSTRTACSTSTTTRRDRKSTRLNSSHANISYAVFCLKKKKTISLFKQQIHQSSHDYNELT